MAPPNAPAMFGVRETTTGGPMVAYPLNGSMHPINILDIAIHWAGVTGGDGLYRLRFQNARGTMDVFTSCTIVECIYQMPADVWRAITQPNPDSDVTLTVAASGTEVRSSAPVQLHVTPDDVKGSLYYWSTRNQGLLRLSFGQQKAVPYDPTEALPNRQQCIGCHSVSRRGQRIAWVADVFEPGRWGTAPTNVAGQSRTAAGATPAVNADGTRVLTAGSGGLKLFDGATAQLISTVDPSFVQGKHALFPEWSPDGKEIAISLASTVTPSRPSLVIPSGSQVAILPYNDGNFGNVRILVPADRDAHYYPSWSPDGKWIVFSSAPGSTYNNAKARLRLIAASGGTIYELGRATQGNATAASWPKFAPFSQAGGQIMFVGYSSIIDYGFLLKHSVPGSPNGATQLWFAAIDLRRLTEGDPSWAPIWLPFQEVTQSNHIPFWTEAEVPVVP